MWGLTVVSAPTAEPLTLDEGKAQLNMVDEDHDDELIDAMLVAVREAVEDRTRSFLMERPVELRLSGFPCGPIYLPKVPKGDGIPPVSVSSITYTDTAGDTQTWSASSYTVDLYSSPPSIVPVYDTPYPSTRDVPNAVVVSYTVGFGSADDIPFKVKAAMKVMLADLYKDRESRIVGTIVANLDTVETLLANSEAADMRYDAIYG
jgi:uncharacterized phiE125 gp8 family phage protein